MDGLQVQKYADIYAWIKFPVRLLPFCTQLLLESLFYAGVGVSPFAPRIENR